MLSCTWRDPEVLFTQVNTRPDWEGQLVQAGMILARSFKLLESQPGVDGMTLEIMMHKMLSNVQVIQCLLNVERLLSDERLQDRV